MPPGGEPPSQLRAVRTALKLAAPRIRGLQAIEERRVRFARCSTPSVGRPFASSPPGNLAPLAGTLIFARLTPTQQVSVC